MRLTRPQAVYALVLFLAAFATFNVAAASARRKGMQAGKPAARQGRARTNVLTPPPPPCLPANPIFAVETDLHTYRTIKSWIDCDAKPDNIGCFTRRVKYLYYKNAAGVYVPLAGGPMLVTDKSYACGSASNLDSWTVMYANTGFGVGAELCLREEIWNTTTIQPSLMGAFNDFFTIPPAE